MSAERHERVEKISVQASALLPEERPDFLERACAGDPSLRSEVEDRLARGVAGSDFPTAEAPTRAMPGGEGPSSEHVLQRLQSRLGEDSRYQIQGEFARGGMGAILRVWDRNLRRALAMKVVLGQGEAAHGNTPAVDEKTLGRFVEEAQVTGQLDHPGIVPVHEIGLDAQGQVYFTMRLVKGDDLGTVFDQLRAGQGGWTQTRVLGVILKVCEAMAYAHSKNVIHRDLKPANVMVGRYGEAYVMDWGLAHVAGQEDGKDIRPKQPESASLSRVRTDRREESGVDSPLLTMDGDVIGTPAYMPPEQARGDIAAVGPASDVYSLGAILYQLLAGHMPFVPPGANLNVYGVLALTQQGPPTPLAKVAPEAPEELVAICEKVMAREPGERYADVQAMAEDLRAFMEGRVVKAHRTGAVVELVKWVRRNRALAAAGAAAVLFAVAGLAVTSYVQARARVDLAAKNTELEEKNAEILRAVDEADTARATAEKREAEALTTQSLFLADLATEQTEAGDALTGILLALEALPADVESPERPHVLQAETALYRALLSVRETADLRHRVAVTNAKFLPDGSRILTSDGFTTWLWDLDGRKLAALRGGLDTISPNGQRIATRTGNDEVVLWDTAGNEVAVLRTLVIETLAFSADASRIVTAGNHDARLWDGRGNELLIFGGFEPQRSGTVEKVTDNPGNGVSIEQAAISADGTRIVTTGEEAALWDAEGNRIAALGDEASRIRYAAFTPGDRHVLTLSRSGVAVVWDREGRRIAELPSVQGGQFSPDGARFLALTSETTASLFDARFEELAVLSHTGSISGATFGADGRLVLTTSEDGTAQIWDAEGRQTAVLVGHGAPVRHVVSDPEMRHVLTSSEDGTARLWDPEGRQLAVLGKYGGTLVAGFSPDGTRIATIGGAHVRLWSVAPRESLLLGEPGTVAYADFGPGGKTLRTLARGTNAGVGDEPEPHRLATWDRTGRGTGPPGPPGPTGDSGGVPYRPAGPGSHTTNYSGSGLMLWRNQVSVNADGSRVLTYVTRRGLQLWDAAGNEIASLRGHHAAFSPDGRTILSTPADPGDPTARLLDLAGNETLVLRGHEGLVSHGCFSADGKRIVTGSDDLTARVWDTQGNQLAVLRGQEKNVGYTLFSPDGGRILTASYDGHAYLWSDDGRLIARLPHYAVVHAAFSPDGSLAVTTSRGRDAMVWDRDGNEVGALRGHGSGVWHAAISPDNRFVVTGADDGTARLWHVDGRQIVVLSGGERSVGQASISPDGRHVLTVTEGTARLHPLYPTPALIESARQLVHRRLAPEQRERFYLGRDPLEQLLDDLFERHVLTEHVLAALDDAGLPDHELAWARRLAGTRRVPTAAELNVEAWKAAHPESGTAPDLERALRLARAAVELAPNSANCRNTLAQMLARNGRQAESRTASARARQLAEDSSVKMFGFTSNPDAEAAEELGVDPETSRLVTSVMSGSTAECAGLRTGDVLTAVDGQPATPDAMLAAKAERDFFDEVPLDVLRDGEPVRVDVPIGARARAGYLTHTSGGVATAAAEPGGAPPPSTPGYVKTTLFFVNGRSDTVSVDWVDFDGDRQNYLTLPPGDGAMQGTVAGHVWVVAAGDQVLGSVVARHEPPVVGRVDIR